MTTDQQTLLRKAEENIGAAGMLTDQGYYDIAISRLYYAMFYCAEAVLLCDNLTFSKHSAVIAAFGQHFAKTGRLPQELHRSLIEAQDMRNLSDYDVMAVLNQDAAEAQLAKARVFLKAVSEFLLAPQQSEH
jgi:uncharacterized protein (UPF0332 family)